MWRAGVRAAVGLEVAVTQIVREHDHDVGRPRLRRLRECRHRDYGDQTERTDEAMVEAHGIPRVELPSAGHIGGAAPSQVGRRRGAGAFATCAASHDAPRATPLIRGIPTVATEW